MNENIITECNDKWGEFDVIFICTLGLLKIAQGVDDSNTLFKDGKPMDYEDYDVYDLTTPLKCENGVVKSIFLFGDGTLEILRENADEPICWDEFSLKSLIQIKERMYDEMKRCFIEK